MFQFLIVQLKENPYFQSLVEDSVSIPYSTIKRQEALQRWKEISLRFQFLIVQLKDYYQDQK